MKFTITALVFFLALGITFKSVATNTEACRGGDNQEHCAESNATEHGNTKSHGNAHEEKLGVKMNSLFPQYKPNPNAVARPSTVKLNSPKFLSEVPAGAVKLEWTPVDGASNYHVQVATDPNFKWLITNDPWVKTNSFDAAQLEAGRKYYWRVAAIRSQNESMFTKSVFVSSVFSIK